MLPMEFSRFRIMYILNQKTITSGPARNFHTRWVYFFMFHKLFTFRSDQRERSLPPISNRKSGYATFCRTAWNRIMTLHLPRHFFTPKDW